MSDWFKSYLVNRIQQTTIQEKMSSQLEITDGVPQGSVLGPLLFLIYINDLNEAKEHSIIHHIADHTNILYSNKSHKKINQYINHDLSLIVQWLQANKISLYQAKTEIIIFQPKGKIITEHLNFKISGQKINPINQIKYLGIYLDKHLSWNSHLNQLKTKVSHNEHNCKRS